MTQQEKQLLLKDICARLPYNVQGITSEGVVTPLLHRGEADWDILTSLNYRIVKHGWRPYLRPMSSMTEEELNELLEFEDIDYNNNSNVVKRAMMAFSEDKRIESNSLFCIQYARSVDWLNAHHFDYRGLIPMRLALEAPEEMYKIN